MSELNFDLYNVTVDDLQEYDLALIAAFVELVGATNAYKKMVEVGVGSFHQYDMAWREFLQAIDRAWNKVLVRCHGEKKWQKLKSKYEKLRKEDPLLKYVAQARNVTEHSISDVIMDWNANLKAQPVLGGIHLSWSPWDRPLLPVTNRGATFLPPKKHLSKSMDYYRQKRPGVEEPRVVAELAMQFYVNLMQEITNEVFPEIKKRNAGGVKGNSIGPVQIL
ncbi:hypothetical protein [Pseudomonas mangiferae]|uniref:Uncharacterized protein n=1 Tax=Pseudomonas mangiferae TaxID=2593654 RepID=A0A553H0J0_9PSED|nr:hypothetical protein [Pseudomonas mangiferae]TRX75259.1 hypothetical protein FM069_09205 [Pseudomonas mangiferae]